MGSDEFLADSYVKQLKQYTSGNVQIFTGLFQPFTEGSPADLLYQIKAAREAGANGIVLFDYAHLNKGFTTALGTRAFTKP